MHVINLRAENIKKLTAIDITPKSEMVYITGPNGAGKSSVLDCITWALLGGKEIDREPLRKGTDKGKIVMDIGTYQITRSFTKDASYLKIEGVDGAKITSPQKFLDDIVGNVSFDPLEFMNNRPEQQREILLNLIGVDTATMDKREKEAREQRTIIGRDRDKAEALKKSLAYYPEVAGKDEINITAKIKEVEDAREYNRVRSEAWDKNEQIKTNATALLANITEWKRLITEAEEKLAEDKKVYIAEKERLLTIEPIDISTIESELDQAEEINKKVRANIEFAKAKEAAETYSCNYDDLTTEIESIIQERKDALINANMPISGLSFDDGGLFYNSIPLAQCSDGEKLMISLAISMALNPTLKVLRIKDGSLLDEKNRAIIAQAVKDKDYQLWYESVGSEGKVGILIEEGEIKSIDGIPVEPKKHKGKVVDKECKQIPTEPIKEEVKEEVGPESTQPTTDGTEDW